MMSLPPFTLNRVLAATAGNHILAVIASDQVAPTTAIQSICAAAADRVGAAQARDGVRTVVSLQHIWARCRAGGCHINLSLQLHSADIRYGQETVIQANLIKRSWCAGDVRHQICGLKITCSQPCIGRIQGRVRLVGVQRHKKLPISVSCQDAGSDAVYSLCLGEDIGGISVLHKLAAPGVKD